MVKAVPLIPATIGAILFALITILYGLFFEKYYVGRNSMIFNSADIIVLAVTTSIGWTTLGMLIIYALIGWVLTRITGYQWIKQFFGSKTYGSLALSLSLYDLDALYWTSTILSQLESSFEPLHFFDDKVVLFAWLIIGSIVAIIGAIVIKRDLQLRI